MRREEKGDIFFKLQKSLGIVERAPEQQTLVNF